jgi:hypothetical protein
MPPLSRNHATHRNHHEAPANAVHAQPVQAQGESESLQGEHMGRISVRHRRRAGADSDSGAGGAHHNHSLLANKFPPSDPRAVLFARRHQDLQLAKELAETCVAMYTEQASGLAPETIVFKPTGTFSVRDPKYVLRPETLESLFVLWRVTGDARYRRQAWVIFEALERQCRTPAAYSGLRDVRVADKMSNWDNSMQSFFLAETLKYLCES